MDQNDIVAQILQMIKGGGQSPQQMPMLQPKGMPGPPPGIRPQGPELPESNDLIALQLALGDVPDGNFPPMTLQDESGMEMQGDPRGMLNDPAIQQLIAAQREQMRPPQARPGYSDIAPSMHLRRRLSPPQR